MLPALGLTVVIEAAVTIPLVWVNVELFAAVTKLLFKVISAVTLMAASSDVRVVVRVDDPPPPEPTEIEPQANVPVPVIVANELFAVWLFNVTALVTCKVTPVIVKESGVALVGANVKDARALAGATVKTGWFVTVGIITTALADEPGFPLGLQFVVVAQSVLVAPVQL